MNIIASETQLSDINKPFLLERTINILLIKPFQETDGLSHSPPLGLLYLIGSLRQKFPHKINFKLIDLKLNQDLPRSIIPTLNNFKPDLVGVSSLNCEGGASREISNICKSISPSIVTVLGGPFALHRSEEILNRSSFDWIFSGPSENSFPRAIERQFNGEALGTDIPGFSYRTAENTLHIAETDDFISDIESLAKPAWDLVDFDAYAERPNMMASFIKGKKYMPLFTSRGCPYLCSYCHDMFTKKYKYQSSESVINDIEHLYNTYGVNEFQLVDDIFNLHKPRMREIMNEVNRRWPGKMYFTFPNGVRADILEDDDMRLLAEAGTYAMAIAIESASDRLQLMIEKNLELEKANNAINQAEKNGIMTTGFFMLGFPTETEHELNKTREFALNSKLSRAYFFRVMPQNETNLYELAKSEDYESLKINIIEEESGCDVFQQTSWYELAYKFPLNNFITNLYLRFYLSPKRILRILRHFPINKLPRLIIMFTKLFILPKNKRKDQMAEQLTVESNTTSPKPALITLD